MTLLLTAFGSGAPDLVQPPVTTVAVAAEPGRPSPEPLATVGNLQLEVPIPPGSLTAIGYRGGAGGALDLQPAGRQANEGILARLWHRIAGSKDDGPVWYQLGSPGTTVVSIGAAPGTDVYAPVDGTVIAIGDNVIAGRKWGSRIDIRPTRAPAVTVSIVNLRRDPVLAVGSPVLASSSKLGSVIDIAAVEEQALAEHAREDGNNVSISVYPASGSLP